jgi:seryl-tRNA synthetase
MEARIMAEVKKVEVKLQGQVDNIKADVRDVSQGVQSLKGDMARFMAASEKKDSEMSKHMMLVQTMLQKIVPEGTDVGMDEAEAAAKRSRPSH